MRSLILVTAFFSILISISLAQSSNRIPIGENDAFASGMDVVGPGVGAIDDLRDILDLAYFYNVSLLC